VKIRNEWPLGLILFIFLGALGLGFLIFQGSTSVSLTTVALLLIASALGLFAYSRPSRPVIRDDRAEREDRAFEDAVKVFERAVPRVRETEGLFAVPIAEFMDVPRVLSAMLKPIYDGPPSDIRRQIDLNRAQLAGRDGKDVWPEKFQGTAQQAVDGFLKHTPLHTLFERRVPVDISDETRFSHTWIVAPPRSGKTNLIQVLLERDFEKVMSKEASVIVMDSQGDLLSSLMRLRDIAPHLCLLDTSDVEYPLSLGLFDMGQDALRNASERDRAAFRNATGRLLEYVFRGILGAELTSSQNTLFVFCIELLLEVPDANLDTFVALLNKGGSRNFAPYIRKLHRDARLFFETKFDADPQTLKRKGEVLDRVFALKRNRELANMFASTRTKVNLYDEMGKGRIILINIPKTLLGEEGVEIFGRYFVALILLAAQRRALLPQRERLPCYFYMDEAHEVIYRDEKITVMLDQARKFNVGCIIAHQRLGQLNEPVLNALLGSTAIKFVRRVTDQEANKLARDMHTGAAALLSLPQHHFALHITDETKRALPVLVPRADLPSRARLSQSEFRALIDDMRQRYAVHVSTLDQRQPPEEHADDAAPEPPVSPQRPSRW